MFKVADLIAAHQSCSARHDALGVPVTVVPAWYDGQHNARHQNRTHGHQHHRRRLAVQGEGQHRPRVSDVETRQPLHRGWIHIPGGPGHVTHVEQRGCVRGMEAVIHRRRESQRDKHAVDALGRQRAVLEQVFEGVGEALGLHQQATDDRPGGHDLTVARRHQVPRIVVDGAGTRAKTTGEACAHRWELRLGRFFQMQVTCDPGEHANQQRGSHGLFPATEPGHHRSGEGARQYVTDKHTACIDKSTLKGRRW